MYFRKSNKSNKYKMCNNKMESYKLWAGESIASASLRTPTTFQLQTIPCPLATSHATSASSFTGVALFVACRTLVIKSQLPKGWGYEVRGAQVIESNK